MLVKGAFFSILLLFVQAVQAGPSVVYRIRSGSQSIQGTSLKRVFGEAHFPIEKDKVWEVLNQVEQYSEFIPRVKAIQVMGQVRGRDQIFISMNLPFPFPDLWNLIALERDPANKKFTWEMIDGNMKKNVGSAQIHEDMNGSRLLIEVEADPGLFLPKWFVSEAAERFLPKVLRAIGDRLKGSPKQEPKDKGLLLKRPEGVR